MEVPSNSPHHQWWEALAGKPAPQGRVGLRLRQVVGQGACTYITSHQSVPSPDPAKRGTVQRFLAGLADGIQEEGRYCAKIQSSIVRLAPGRSRPWRSLGNQ